MDKPKLAYIPLGDIRASEVALREVNREGEGYKELLGSVKVRGILNAINVREKKDEKNNNKPYYEIIDGLHRYTAATEAGLEAIPAQILSLDDAALYEAQIIGNVQRVETKPIEFTKGILRILGMNPLLTEAELAVKLGKSPTWLQQRLSLNKLDEKVAELVNEGKIPLSNAYPLTKLPKEEQGQWVSRAMTEGTQIFSPAVLARDKEIKAANRKGQDASQETFTPQPYLRKLSELKDEYESNQIGPGVVEGAKPKTVEEAFALGVAWCINMDPESQKLAVAKNEERKKTEEQAKIKRDAEKKAARAKEAAERQAKLMAESEEAKKKATDAGIKLDEPKATEPAKELVGAT